MLNIKKSIGYENLKTFNQQEVYTRKKPQSTENIESVLELQNRCGSYIDWDNNCPFKLNQQEYVAVIPNGRIGSEGAVYTENDIYVLNDIYPQHVPNTQPTNHYDELVTIVQKWGYGYYHWMAECFPRLLQFLKDYDGDKSKIKVLTWDEPFVRQYFKLIGLNKEQLVPFNSGQVYASKKLYVPTPIYCGNPHKDSLKLIKETLKNYLYDGDERVNIIISREGQAKRTLKNFDSLCGRLKKEFPNEKWVIYDSMDVIDSISLFSKARLVVAVHGAGLTNMVFSPEDCKVVEIIPSRNCVNVCHWHTISSLGLDYRMIPVDFINPIHQVEVDFNKVIQNIKDF